VRVLDQSKRFLLLTIKDFETEKRESRFRCISDLILRIDISHSDFFFVFFSLLLSFFLPSF